MRLSPIILASSLVFAFAASSSDAHAADKKKSAKAPKTTAADPDPEAEPAATAKQAPPAAATKQEAPPAEPGGGKPASAPPADTSGRFKIRRGLFAEGDLGLFLTFGGRNTNDPGLPSRSTSNVQPQLGLTVGYDLVHGETYNFS